MKYQIKHPGQRRNLIIGMAGSGKTTIVEHMQAQGHFALDGDLVEGLGVWRDANGEPATYQSSREWREKHVFSWSRERLQELLLTNWPNGEQRPLYLFGAAPYIERHSYWFHNVLALHADASTIFNRLRHPARRTPYPFEIGESDLPSLEQAIDRFHSLTTQCLGYTAVDATQPVADVAKEIVSQCVTPHASPRESMTIPLSEMCKLLY